MIYFVNSIPLIIVFNLFNESLSFRDLYARFKYSIFDEYIDSIKENYYKMSKKINNQQVLCSITEEVRGRKKHKVLTIFGIKFKFKVKSK